MEWSCFVVTMDTDWVPQFMLEHALDMLYAQNVPVTVFCTSAYTIQESSQLELAIHPNLMRDSTHGDDEESCLRNVQTLYPQAIGFRSHRYYWHSGMYSLLRRNGLCYDSSIMLPFQSHLQFSHQFGIIRFPVWCGDNLYMDLRPATAVFDPPGINEPGLKVLNFHPIHIYFNSNSTATTRQLIAGHRLDMLDESYAKKMRRAGNGMEKVFYHAISLISQRQNATTLRCLLSNLQ